MDVPRDQNGWPISSSPLPSDRLAPTPPPQERYEAWKEFRSEVVNAIREAHTQSGAIESSRKEYKVLTQKDKWFTAKFDPAKLEEALNAYAEQGWRVIAVTTASIPGLTANREEMVVILER